MRLGLNFPAQRFDEIIELLGAASVLQNLLLLLLPTADVDHPDLVVVSAGVAGLGAASLVQSFQVAQQARLLAEQVYPAAVLPHEEAHLTEEGEAAGEEGVCGGLGHLLHLRVGEGGVAAPLHVLLLLHPLLLYRRHHARLPPHVREDLVARGGSVQGAALLQHLWAVLGEASEEGEESVLRNGLGGCEQLLCLSVRLREDGLLAVLVGGGVSGSGVHGHHVCQVGGL